jgi:hypothetical protein
LDDSFFDVSLPAAGLVFATFFSLSDFGAIH